MAGGLTPWPRSPPSSASRAPPSTATSSARVADRLAVEGRSPAPSRTASSKFPEASSGYLLLAGTIMLQARLSWLPATTGAIQNPPHSGRWTLTYKAEWSPGGTTLAEEIVGHVLFAIGLKSPPYTSNAAAPSGFKVTSWKAGWEDEFCRTRVVRADFAPGVLASKRGHPSRVQGACPRFVSTNVWLNWPPAAT